ncbi:MAG: hypothetical protein EA412_03225 [Chitinophagaceae bacterium]|nr:MAG: hypothetical protein EA412_03225 [Chitinophagaceae bacterium]
MATNKIFLYPVVMFVFWLLINYGWYTWAPVNPHAGFFLGSNIFFFILTLIAFLLAKISVNSKNKTLFLNVFMGIMTVKFLTSLMLVGFYLMVFSPEDFWFLVPFFALFSTYKAMEISVLLMLNKQSENTT